MKKYFRAIIISLLIIPFNGYSIISDLVIKKINNTDFLVYEINSNGVTVNSLSELLEVNENKILKYNPVLKDSIVKGQKIFFPINDFIKKKSNNIVAKPTYFEHKVKSGETLYGISKLYNISIDSILLQNPACSNGLKSGQILIIPQGNTNGEVSQQEETIIYHTIKSGNTLYNISKKYNTTIEDIINLNPGVSPTNFKIGDVIKVNINSITNPEFKTSTNVQFVNHKIQDGESFETIAKKYDINLNLIVETNSIQTMPSVGTIISIPMFGAISDDEILKIERAKGIEVYDSINKKQSDNEINIALILPFALKDSKNKKARLYHEFYKGFLVAVDSVRRTTDKKIRIFAFDTHNSVDSINSILNDTVFNNVNLIIGPNEKDEFDAVSEFSMKKNINLVNPFIIKADDYNDNDNFFHVNIPNNFMHTKLINYYDELFEDWTPIFLSSNDNEAKDIALKIREEIVDRGKFHHDIEVGKQLSYELTDTLLKADKKYIFIPLSPSKSMLKLILPTLTRLKEKREDTQFALFGFPEWTSYNSKLKDEFKKVDTYVYSRFFLDKTNPDYLKFIEIYEKWYNQHLINAMPAFGLFGYETGLYFMSNLIQDNNLDNNLSVYDGIQTPFNFKRISNWGGYINWAICFIHYNQENTERTVR